MCRKLRGGVKEDGCRMKVNVLLKVKKLRRGQEELLIYEGKSKPVAILLRVAGKRGESGKKDNAGLRGKLNQRAKRISRREGPRRGELMSW